VFTQNERYARCPAITGHTRPTLPADRSKARFRAVRRAFATSGQVSRRQIGEAARQFLGHVDAEAGHRDVPDGLGLSAVGVAHVQGVPEVHDGGARGGVDESVAVGRVQVLALRVDDPRQVRVEPSAPLVEQV
jgi:hypothetical protein